MSENKKGQKQTFKIREIPIYGDLILGPMDGYSDLPFRSLARQLGSAMSYTEFINAIDVINGHPHIDKKLAYLETERPVVYQIFDDDPDRLVQAAIILRKRNPDIIDVNMGCSARCVTSRGAGAGLLKSPAKIATIIKKMTSNLDIPITAKIRLGWDSSSMNYLEIAKIIEENGAQLIAVHGRTKMQAYTGEADWDAIAKIKACVHIPVIANGDVKRVSDIEKIRKITGCDGVMIARAAISNPWIFSRFDREDVNQEQLRQTMLQHLQIMLDFYGEDRGLVLFRKYAARYLLPYQMNSNVRTKLLTANRKDEFLLLLEEIIAN